MTKILAVLCTAAVLGAIAWFALASPQATFYRAQNASRDTVIALAAFRDSAERAASIAWDVGNRFHERQHKGFETRKEFLRYAGKDSAKVGELLPGKPESFFFSTAVGRPKLFGRDSLEVLVTAAWETLEDMSYSVVQRLGNDAYVCSGRYPVTLRCEHSR